MRFSRSRAIWGGISEREDGMSLKQTVSAAIVGLGVLASSLVPGLGATDASARTWYWHNHHRVYYHHVYHRPVVRVVVHPVYHRVYHPVYVRHVRHRVCGHTWYHHHRHLTCWYR